MRTDWYPAALFLLLLPCTAGAQMHHGHPAPADTTVAKPTMDMGGMDMGDMPMTGFYGSYPMTREASGTAWQPESAPMPAGYHERYGFWNLMVHGWLDVAYTDQGGPRGDEDLFVPGMLMGMFSGPFGPGQAGVRIMLSPDPLMGRAGYPLLFQSGETSDGFNHLVDRQHPHDFFMELAGTYSLRLGDGASVFAYGGLPGEPALGPAAFMHRASGMDIPEAPITHHWLDSTHITFGVGTLGATYGPWKVEGSLFNGHEPDQNRWNIETRSLDSASGRVTYNPTKDWSAQVSYGYLAEPEQLHPGESVHRTTASVSHTRAYNPQSHWSTTLAAAINRSEDHDQPGFLLESTLKFDGPYRAFTRAEYVRNSELIETGPLAGEEFGVAKLTGGGSYDFAAAGPVMFSGGALASLYRYDESLESEYGERPISFLVFVRTSLR